MRLTHRCTKALSGRAPATRTHCAISPLNHRFKSTINRHVILPNASGINEEGETSDEEVASLNQARGAGIGSAAGAAIGTVAAGPLGGYAAAALGAAAGAALGKIMSGNNGDDKESSSQPTGLLDAPVVSDDEWEIGKPHVRQGTNPQPSATERVTDWSSKVGEQVRDTMDGATERVSQGVRTVSHQVAAVSDRVTEAAENVGGRVLDGGYVAADKMGEAALRLGVAPGQVVDQTSEVASRAKDAASKVGEKTSDIAAKAYERASSVASRAGDVMVEDGEKLKEVGVKAKDMMGEAALEIGVGPGEVVDEASEVAARTGDKIKEKMRDLEGSWSDKPSSLRVDKVSDDEFGLGCVPGESAIHQGP